MEFQWIASATPEGLQETQRERGKSLLELRISSPGSVFWRIKAWIEAAKTGRQRKNSPWNVRGGDTPHLYLSSPFKFPTVREWPAGGQCEIPVTMDEPQIDRCKDNTFLSNPGVHSWARVKLETTNRYSLK